MGFKLRNDAKRWFKKIRDKKDNSFNVEFDSYYFCLISGLLTEDQTDVLSSDLTEFIDYFPDKYKNKGKVLIGLFLSKELRKMGVSFEEKTQVHSIVSKLIDPQSHNYLSEEGMKQFNRYANAGFDMLSDNIDKPETLEDFLVAFNIYIKKNNY